MIWLSQCDPKDQGCLQQSLEESSNMQDLGPCLLNSLNEKLYYKIDGPMRGMIVYGGRFRVIGKEGGLKYFIVHSMHMKILGGTQASFFSCSFPIKDTVFGSFLVSHMEKKVEILLLSDMLCPLEHVFFLGQCRSSCLCSFLVLYIQYW